MQQVPEFLPFLLDGIKDTVSAMITAAAREIPIMMGRRLQDETKETLV